MVASVLQSPSKTAMKCVSAFAVVAGLVTASALYSSTPAYTSSTEVLGMSGKFNGYGDTAAQTCLIKRISIQKKEMLGYEPETFYRYIGQEKIWHAVQNFPGTDVPPRSAIIDDKIVTDCVNSHTWLKPGTPLGKMAIAGFIALMGAAALFRREKQPRATV